MTPWFAFCHSFFQCGVTGKCTPYLLCITEAISGSGNSGAGNKIYDEKEALGWSEEVSKVFTFYCCSLFTLAVNIIIFLQKKNLSSHFSLYFCISFLFPKWICLSAIYTNILHKIITDINFYDNILSNSGTSCKSTNRLMNGFN